MKAHPKRRWHHSQSLEQPLRCGICHVGVAPYEMAVKVMGNIYHPQCLDHLRHDTRKVRTPSES